MRMARKSMPLLHEMWVTTSTSWPIRWRTANMHLHTLWLRSLCQMSGLSHHLPLPVCFSIDFLPIHVIIWVNVRCYVTMLGTVQLFHRLSKWYCLASGVHWMRTNSTLDTVIQFYSNNREMCFVAGWDSKGQAIIAATSNQFLWWLLWPCFLNRVYLFTAGLWPSVVVVIGPLWEYWMRLFMAI